MNIPQIYLVEPYNAYAPKQKKKHWHQVIEEEALMARIIAEQQALQEAASNNKNATLAPQMPPQATPPIVGSSAGAGQTGQPGSSPGGGGMPQPAFFNPNMTIVPSATPSSASVPGTVQFHVTGDSRTLSFGAVNINWNFGDGGAGGGQSPSHTYDVGGFYTVQMTASSVQNPSNVTMLKTFVSISAPTIVSQFTPQGATVVYTAPYYTASAGDTITLRNTSTATDAVTYAWTMPSGTPASSTAISPSVTYATPGNYTVTVTATDAYGDSDVDSSKIQITPAALVASISSPPDNDTGASPLTETFVNGTVIPGISNPVTWKWIFDSGSLADETTQNPAAPIIFINPGTFSVKLEATGSDGQKSATSISVIAT
jgi:PKD repeat protein